MTHLCFVTSAFTAVLSLRWPPGEGGSRRIFQSRAVPSVHSVSRPPLARGGLGHQLLMYFSMLSSTFAACCMMDGSVFLTSCWMVPVLWFVRTQLNPAKNLRSVTSCAVLVPCVGSLDVLPWRAWWIVVMSLSKPRYSHAAGKTSRACLALKFQVVDVEMWLFRFQLVVRLPLRWPHQCSEDCAIECHGLVVVTGLGGHLSVERAHQQMVRSQDVAFWIDDVFRIHPRHRELIVSELRLGPSLSLGGLRICVRYGMVPKTRFRVDI